MNPTHPFNDTLTFSEMVAALTYTHRLTGEKMLIKKDYGHGVVSCYLINQPRVRNIHGNLEHPTCLTSKDNLITSDEMIAIREEARSYQQYRIDSEGKLQ